MKELTLPAVIANLDPITDFVNEELEAMDCPMKAQMQLDIAIDEVFSNVAYYAYAPGEGDVTVRVEEHQEPHGVRLTFLDRGIPYDPLKKDDPDVTKTIEEREIGGLGIFMVKKSMDRMDYVYENGQNVLSLEKYFG